MENISLEDKIQIILRQTNYSEFEVREKLQENNFDHIKVIKLYLTKLKII